MVVGGHGLVFGGPEIVEFLGQITERPVLSVISGQVYRDLWRFYFGGPVAQILKNVVLLALIIIALLLS